MIIRTYNLPLHVYAVKTPNDLIFIKANSFQEAKEKAIKRGYNVLFIRETIDVIE